MKIYRGFSLIEVTIVLVVIGLLLGSLLIPLSVQIDQQKIALTKKRLEEIKEALLGFAIIYNRLPCVDTDTIEDSEYGKESINLDDPTDPKCESNGEGYLPWKDLGVGRYDGFGNQFRYQTENAFNNLSGFSSTNPTSGLRIKNRNDNDFTNTGDSYVVAIIFSCGKNGRPDPTNPFPNTIDKNKTNDANGIRNTDTLCNNKKPSGGQNKTYIYDVYVENEFDDILTWLSKNTLMNRLVAAGQWPPP